MISCHTVFIKLIKTVLCMDYFVYKIRKKLFSFVTTYFPNRIRIFLDIYYGSDFFFIKQ